MAQAQNIIRGIAAAGPVLSAVKNKIGAAVASISGTPTKQGSWQIQIQQWADGFKWAIANDSFGSGTTRRPVQTGKAYTDIIPGLTVTMGGTLNAGDVTNISYTDVYVVHT